jgi:tetratricopeptide (TPR) repeat protein
VAVMSFITVYFAYLGYKASNLEYQIKKDESNSFKNAILTGDELIKKIPLFKNTLLRGEAFDEYIGIYYYYENKLDLALKYLSKAEKINPYLGRIPLYKMRIALKKGNLDSAFVYSKEAFYLRPRNLNFYILSIQMARGKKDTLEILKQHRTFTKYRNIPQVWKLAADELKKTKYNNKSLLAFINKGLKQFPGDTTLIKTKNEIIANGSLDKAKSFLNHDKTKALQYYLEALEKDSSNADIMQYLAFYYYNANDYKQSLNYFLEALKLREFTGGRTEFFVGNCYLKLNDKSNALKYLNLSEDKGYLPAKDLIAQLSTYNNNQNLLKKRENDLLIASLITQGQKLAEQKKFDEALKTYKKALTIDPKNIYVAQNIGFHYFKTGNPKRAINYLLNALKYPGLTDGKTEYFLAVCYLQQNDKANACKYWDISKNKNYSNSLELFQKFCK